MATHYHHSVTIWFLESHAITHRFSINTFTFGTHRTPPLTTNYTPDSSINLSRQSIDEILILSPAVSSLQNLGVLCLDHNRLTNLPLELFSLLGLEELNLGFNLLRRLPPEVGQLRRLRELLVDENQLSEIPVQVGLLNELKVLDVSRNPVLWVPSVVGRVVRDGCEFIEAGSKQRGGMRLVEIMAQIIGRVVETKEHFYCSEGSKKGHVCVWDSVPVHLKRRVMRTKLTVKCGMCRNGVFCEGLVVVERKKGIAFGHAVCSEECWRLLSRELGVLREEVKDEERIREG